MKRLYYCLPVIFIFISGCSVATGIRIRLPSVPQTPMASLISRPLVGVVYTHTIRPLDVNANQTPVGLTKSSSDIKYFNYYLNVMWDSNAIGEIAKENGIRNIYYADLETVSILRIWTQYTVHVYGN